MYFSRALSATRSLLGKAASTTTTAGGGGRKTVVSGFRKEFPVSPAMSKFLGVPEISRTQAVKKLWDYVKLHNLQNPENKRVIMCDEKLKTIFAGKDEVGMLEMAKLISAHFMKPT